LVWRAVEELVPSNEGYIEQRNMTASDLTPRQQKAVATLEKNTLVTAGAGSGKTRTLVARYLELLKTGSPPRRVAAITFTEKAAREMRNRVREAVAAQAKAAVNDGEKERWEDVLAAMDSARIGTIHSLCAEILRTHPAEAKVDPDFEVVDEGIGLALRAQAIEDVLTWATDQTDIAPIFEAFKTMGLERLLQFLMARRLEADMLLDDVNVLQRMYQAIDEELEGFIKNPEVADIIESWRNMERSGRLAEDAGKKLTACISELLEAWNDVEGYCGSGNNASKVTEIAAALFSIRRRYLKGGIGRKDSEAKRMHTRLQSIYDERLDPWLGGKKKSDEPPELNIEIRYQEDLPRLKALFGKAVSAYRGSLEARYALDFDDLEAGALMLLKQPEIQRRWQQNLSAILVDEFQDTNNRQRDIVEALCGDEPGRLFVVGDARQSIYRFRGADVTVFRGMERTVVEDGGETVELDLTFRAHKQLLNTIEGLLEPVLNVEGKRKELFQAPFTWLSANRNQPALDIRPPYVEIICGIGENADEARPQAAKALIRRLMEMKYGGQFQSWEDVAFLFRASTGFGAYEDALEELNVPFVTHRRLAFPMRPSTACDGRMGLHVLS
jgi:ATP-dependent helicase/nuclease subunit A